MRFHTELKDLQLSKFIDCIADNNLLSLLIDEIPEQVTEVIWNDLSEAWNKILAEYAELTGNSEYRMFVELYKEVEILKITLVQINFLAGIGNIETGEPKGVLRFGYDEFFASELNNLLKTDFKLNWNDQKTYHEQLDKAIRRSKSIKIKYDLKASHFISIQKKNTGNTQKPTRQYFTSILVTLSDHAKYRIDETIKMPEYCERIKRFTQYCERQKKHKNGRRADIGIY